MAIAIPAFLQIAREQAIIFQELGDGRCPSATELKKQLDKMDGLSWSDRMHLFATQFVAACTSNKVSPTRLKELFLVTKECYPPFNDTLILAIEAQQAALRWDTGNGALSGLEDIMQDRLSQLHSVITGKSPRQPQTSVPPKVASAIRDGDSAALRELIAEADDQEWMLRLVFSECITCWDSNCIQSLLWLCKDWISRTSMTLFVKQALMFGRADIVRVMYEEGYLFPMQNVDSYPCFYSHLCAAIEGPNPAIAEWMLASRGALPYQGIYCAIRVHNYAILENYWTDVCEMAGQKPVELLQWVIACDSYELCDLLFPKDVYQVMGTRLISEAVKFKSESIRWLLAKEMAIGKLLRFKGESGNTIFHLIAMKCDPWLARVVYELVNNYDEFTAHMYVQNEDFMTALDYARSHQSFNCGRASLLWFDIPTEVQG